MKIRYILLVAVVGAICSCQTHNSKTALKKAVIADSAMVVTAHPLASKVGIDIIKKGGNAIDAAVAVQFALAVVYPAAGNLGGGGFLIYRDNQGATDALDFREKAPLQSYADMYLDENGDAIEDLSRSGHLAAGVPGTVDGMITAHEKYGSLPWEVLIQPAIDLAKTGFQLTKNEAESLNKHTDRLEEHSTVPPIFFLRNWSEGDTLRLTELANTLVRIKNNKRNGFYSGKTANLIVAEMKRSNGIISFKDLEQYHSKWRQPIEEPFKNYKVISMPPPSSGGVALIQLLKMVEDVPLGSYGFHSPEAIHYMVECERRVYADRATHLGDPDFYQVPVKELMDKKYLTRKAALINANYATPSDSVQAGNFPVAQNESEETTHFSIVDKEGNAAAVTTTLNGSYGSHVVVAGAGFLLNNEMDDFSVKAGVPNMYGLIGGEANAIVPQKRMLSSMTPTIIEKEGELYMVLGTPGGSTIITSVFQTILNVVEFDMTMQEAVNAGRFHHQWKPDVIAAEQGTLSKKVRQALQQKGHQIEARNQIGRVDAILVMEDGKLEGAADFRGDDTALGF